MNDAPEKIWATGNKTTGSWNHTPLSLRIAPVQTEYTRTDIAQAYIDAIDSLAMFLSVPRIVELEGALEEIGHMGFDMPATLDLTDEAWSQRRAGMMQHIARATLKDTTNE
jgi:hypothetical protein